MSELYYVLCRSAISYSSNGRGLFVSTLDSRHRLFPRYQQEKIEGSSSLPLSVVEQATLKEYRGHTNKRFALCTRTFRLQGNREILVSGSEKGQVCMWDVATAQLLISFLAHHGTLCSVPSPFYHHLLFVCWHLQ